ncbi:MAG: thioredoxin family protein [Gammaproteobacteria bacterium]|jgi:thiol-disulfide isomerase/thioredoxin|tara:strand:- start:1202 stop:1705 length:504 start_codon:yes stop_codon:yes gene_type:complete
MIINLIKYYSFLSLVIIPITMSANDITMPPDEVLKMPLPLPYNGEIYSESDIERFLDSSINKSKQPIIIFGGNWCPDCRILEGTLQLPTIKKYMIEHYEIMHVDVGRYDKNMNLISYFKIPKEEGVPRVLVFDTNKNILNMESTKEWTTARDRKQQEIFNYFQALVQ